MTALPATDITRMACYRRTDDRDLIPLVSPTTVFGAGSNGSDTFSWGFDFRIDGATYTGSTVCGNPFLDLIGFDPGGARNTLFGAYNCPLITPWMDNAGSTAVSVGYLKAEVQGEAPERRCVFEWYFQTDIDHPTTDCDRAKLQVVLYETWDRIEFRYGALESIGSPDRSGYSAAIGIRGDTTSEDRRRSVLTDALPFGGSDSSTPDYAVAPDDWPACTYVFEPAYPYVGRVMPIGPDELTGLQDPYAAPIRKLTNNLHHLWLKHSPALMNVAPYFASGSSKGHIDQSIVQISEPSVDVLEYDFRTVTYCETANTSVGLSFGKNNVDAPDPDDDSDWTELASATLSPAIGTIEWPTFQAVLEPASDDGLTNRLYRWRFTCSSLTGGANKHLKVLGLMATPRGVGEIDPALGTASGFKFVSIAQFVQEGASIHPETYNRIWKGAAGLMASRHQRLFSIAIPFVHGATPKGALQFTADAAKPARTIGVAPCSFVGQGGATLRVTAYAYDTSASGGHLYVSERGGGTGCDLDVAEGPGYLVTAQTLRVLTDQPTLAAIVQPGSEMHLLDLHADWVPTE